MLIHVAVTTSINLTESVDHELTSARRSVCT